MRTKLWVGVGAFVLAQSGSIIVAEAVATPLSTTADQLGESGENERGEGEAEGEGERQGVRSVRPRSAVKNSRRVRAAQQYSGQRGEGEYEGGEYEGGENEGGENEGGEGER